MPSEADASGASSGAPASAIDEQQASPLRASWQFASCVQFCRLFGQTLRIPRFSADQLERALLHPAGHNIFLSELGFKLLRLDVSQQPTEKELEEWQDLLSRRVNSNWHVSFESNPLQADSFFDVSPLTRASGAPPPLRAHSAHPAPALPVQRSRT